MSKRVLVRAIRVALLVAVATLSCARPATAQKFIVSGPPRLIDNLSEAERLLHQHWSKGVTADNNLALALLQVQALDCFADRRIEDICSMLSIDRLPVAKRPFVSPFDFALRERLADFEATVANSAWVPWSAEKHPELARLLEENKTALDLIVSAGPQDQFYLPMLHPDKEDTTILNIPLTIEANGESIALLLSARAMLSFSDGKTDAAITDLLTSWRLSVLLQRYPAIATMENRMSPYTYAQCALRRIIRSRRLDDTSLAALQRKCEAVPRCVPVRHLVWYGDRLLVRDTVDSTRRGEGPPQNRPDEMLEMFRFADWKSVCAAIDHEYLQAIGSLDTRGPMTSTEEHKQFTKRMRAWLPEARSPENRPDIQDPKQVGTWVGRVFASQMMGAAEPIETFLSNMKMQREITMTVVALERFRVRHDGYPEKLSELVPDLLSKVPDDRHAEGPIRYKRTDEGYEVWSRAAVRGGLAARTEHIRSLLKFGVASAHYIDERHK